MARTWKLWVGDLDHRDGAIIVPGEVRMWADGVDPGDPVTKKWYVSEQVQVGEASGMSDNEVKALLVDKLKNQATPIRDQYELWQRIQDAGGVYIPSWP